MFSFLTCFIVDRAFDQDFQSLLESTEIEVLDKGPVTYQNSGCAADARGDTLLEIRVDGVRKGGVSNSLEDLFGIEAVIGGKLHQRRPEFLRRYRSDPSLDVPPEN